MEIITPHETAPFPTELVVLINGTCPADKGSSAVRADVLAMACVFRICFRRIITRTPSTRITPTMVPIEAASMLVDELPDSASIVTVLVVNSPCVVGAEELTDVVAFLVTVVAVVVEEPIHSVPLPTEIEPFAQLQFST
jgi:hypothetical protein